MDTRTATAELGWTANPASGVSVNHPSFNPAAQSRDYGMTGEAEPA